MDKYFSKIFNYLSKKTNTPKDQLYTKYVNYFIIIDVILMWDLIFRKNKCVKL